MNPTKSFEPQIEKHWSKVFWQTFSLEIVVFLNFIFCKVHFIWLEMFTISYIIFIFMNFEFFKWQVKLYTLGNVTQEFLFCISLTFRLLLYEINVVTLRLLSCSIFWICSKGKDNLNANPLWKLMIDCAQ